MTEPRLYRVEPRLDDDKAPSASDTAEGRADALALLTPLLEGRRILAAGVLLACLIVGITTLMRPRLFKAELTLSPVGSSITPSALGGLAASLAGAGMTGFQLTPARFVELLLSRRVLAAVALSPVAGQSTTRVIDRLPGTPPAPGDLETLHRRVINLVNASINKETGTITVRVDLSDSALARTIAQRAVAEASQAFVETARAQATQLRIAQTVRVDSAARQLRRAEEDLRAFLSANRASVAPFSVASLERERLQRAILLYSTVYTQAVTDRESAVAKELQETPTVVVVDSLPPTLPAVRRRLIFKVGLTALVSFVVIATLLLLREFGRRRLTYRDTTLTRFLTAAGRTPVLRRVLHPAADDPSAT
jgi:hypothetical protein